MLSVIPWFIYTVLSKSLEELLETHSRDPRTKVCADKGLTVYCCCKEGKHSCKMMLDCARVIGVFLCPRWKEVSPHKLHIILEIPSTCFTRWLLHLGRRLRLKLFTNVLQLALCLGCFCAWTTTTKIPPAIKTETSVNSKPNILSVGLQFPLDPKKYYDCGEKLVVGLLWHRNQTLIYEWKH